MLIMNILFTYASFSQYGVLFQVTNKASDVICMAQKVKTT